MASKIKGLQLWCRKMTEGYRDVDVKDFTVSWRDGLAFCALVHRFRPDLIDYDSLSKENVYDNNNLAFTVAENELQIPAFLEAADMVALKTPDKLSIITYVSQYYNKLHSMPQLGGPGVKGKAAASTPTGVKRHQKPEPLSEPEPKKAPPSEAAKGAKTTTLGDKCKICGNKVYLLERHIEGGQLYHRSCYKHSDLSPTNKIYSRSPFLSPSLHGKAEPKTSTPNSPSVSHTATDLSRTYILDGKHSAKAHDTPHGHQKSGVQKQLFGKENDSKQENKADSKHSKHSDTGGHFVKDVHRPSGLKVHTSSADKDDNHDKKTAATPSFDARTFEKHSTEFLSSEKEAKDVKAPKRQLPLIFQSPDADTNSSESKTNAVSKLSSALAEASARKDSHAHSSHSANQVTDQKSPAPVAKPRNFGKKTTQEKMDTTEPVQTREKTSGMPKPAPRASVRAKTPSPARRNVPRPKSSRDHSPESSSPPPLPSSAPPPLPLSAPPSAVHLPSSRHESSSRPTNHESASHPTSTDVHHMKKSTHTSVSTAASAATGSVAVSSSAKSTVSTTVPSSTSSSHGSKVLGKAFAGLKGVFHPHKTSHKAAELTSESHALKATHSATEASTTSHTVRTVHTVTESGTGHKGTHATTGAGLTGASHSATVQSKPAHTVLSIPTGARKEEPMDIDTAINKACAQSSEEPVAVMVVPADRGEQERKTRTGLLSSLANIRKTSASNSSSSVSSSESASTVRSLTSVTTLNTAGSSISNAASSSGSETVSVSGSNTASSSGSFAASSSSAYNAGSSSSDRSVNSDSAAKGFVSSKMGKFLTKDSETKRANVELKTVRNDKHTEHTDEKSQSSVSVGRQDRSKSAGDVLGKEMSASKETASSEAPPFLQVKLRSTNAAGENNRPKTTGSVLEDETVSSKPVWQAEAERRMAVLRDGGFVDPETKKSAGDNKNMKEDAEKRIKNGMANEKSSATSLTGGGHSEAKWAHKDEIPRISQQSKIQIKINKPTVTSDTKKEPEVANRTRVLPTVIKPADRTKGSVQVEFKPSSEEIKLKSENATAARPAHSLTHLTEKERPAAKSQISVSDTTVSNKTAQPETESQRMLKKITAKGHPAPHPPDSPAKPRKKVSVDISFDFNTNHAEPTQEEAPTIGTTYTIDKHTPPPRPPPPRKTPSPAHLSAIELQKQLLDIDNKLTELELRGRQLEDSIRSVDTATEEDEMMVEWFELVTEKNELIRQEADLVYMSREQDLEGEQSKVDNQLRYLLSKDESEKSFEEKTEEEYLIKLKLEIVDQRNCIVDSMDEDRLRYEKEDRDIAQMLESKGLSKDATGHIINEKGKKVAASTFYA